MVNSIHYLPGLGSSDHVCVSFKLDCVMAPTAKQLPIYNFHKGDYNEIRRLLSQINWNELLKDIDTNAAWYVFNDKLKSIIQLCVPIEVMNTTKKKCPYINSKVFKLRHQKETLWRKFLLTGSNLGPFTIYSEEKCY